MVVVISTSQRSKQWSQGLENMTAFNYKSCYDLCYCFLCRRGRHRTSLVFSSASDGKLSRMFVIDWGGSPHISRPCEVSMGYWSGALLSSSSNHVIKILSTAMSSVIVESELFENFRYTARITSGVSYSASPLLSATSLLVDWNWRQTLSATRPW